MLCILMNMRICFKFVFFFENEWHTNIFFFFIDITCSEMSYASINQIKKKEMKNNIFLIDYYWHNLTHTVYHCKINGKRILCLCIVYAPRLFRFFSSVSFVHIWEVFFCFKNVFHAIYFYSDSVFSIYIFISFDFVMIFINSNFDIFFCAVFHFFFALLILAY